MTRLQRLQMKLVSKGKNISIGFFEHSIVINDIDNNICRTFNSVYDAEEYMEEML